MSSLKSENIEEISTDTSQQRTEVKSAQKKHIMNTKWGGFQKVKKCQANKKKSHREKNPEILAQPCAQVKVTVTEAETEGREKDLVCLCCPWITETWNVTYAVVKCHRWSNVAKCHRWKFRLLQCMSQNLMWE